ncbi:MAG TPA: 7-cyano-7-deazaguanine synthase [archaeon]|nr:7-cyano-7-deazaguanine synthase [archaeon]
MKGLLLLSGGFDSPVAGHLMKRQGVDIIAVHFSSKLVTDVESEKKSDRLAQKLDFKRFFSIDISPQLIRLSKECNHKLYFVLMKRLMYKIAERIAKKEKCKFLITGENLAQVSSQTLQNLGIIDRSVNLPVMRPLLGLDKQEIINMAKEIGTYEISCGPEHCDALGPLKPITKAKLREVLEAEDQINIKALVDNVLSMI